MGCLLPIIHPTQHQPLSANAGWDSVAFSTKTHQVNDNAITHAGKHHVGLRKLSVQGQF